MRGLESLSIFIRKCNKLLGLLFKVFKLPIMSPSYPPLGDGVCCPRNRSVLH